MRTRPLQISSALLFGVCGFVILVGSVLGGPDFFDAIVGVVALVASSLTWGAKPWSRITAIVLGLTASFPLVMIQARGLSQEEPTAFAKMLSGPLGWALLVAIVLGVLLGSWSLVASRKASAQERE